MQILILLSFIPFFYLAFLLARRVSHSEKMLELMTETLPLATSLILTVVGVAGRLWHLFVPAVLGGSAFCLFLALGVQWFWRPSLPSLRWSLKIRGSDWPLILLLLLSTYLVSAVALKFAIYDEVRLQGHMPVVESILRGNFPPAYTAFPEIPYRYHYGFNLLAAYFSRAFGLPGYLGIDIAALYSWISLVPLLLLLLRRLGVPRAALGLAFALITMTGGLSWIISKNDPGMGAVFQLPHWQQMFVMWRGIHPHFMMYFFQHPMGLGVGLFLGILLYLQRFFERPSWFILFLSAFMLGALSLAQVALFVTLLAALGVIFFLRFFGKDSRRLLNLFQGLAVAGVALALALLLGGFFQFSANLENQPIQLSWPPSYLRYEFWGARHPLTWAQNAIWYLSGFGWPLLAIPVAWLFVWRKSEPTVRLLAVFCGICFLVPLFFRYPYSWDIIKWYFGFEFSGKILVSWAFLPWMIERGWRQALAWALVLFGMVTPLRFLGDLAFKPRDRFTRAEFRIAAYTQPQLQGSFKDLMTNLIGESAKKGLVWSSPQTSEHVALFTGLSMLQMDRNTVAMPVRRARITERQAAIQKLESDPSLALLQEQQVRWAIFTCAEWNALPAAKKFFFQSLQENPQVEVREYSGGNRDCYRTFQFKFP